MDVNGGQTGNQTNGNPALPGTTWEGPLLAGSVVHSDGSGNLAGVGGTTGTANVGYAVMAQTGIVTQAANTTSTVIVIPSQSQILHMTMMVTTAWTAGNTTFGIGTTGNATFLTSAGAGNASALGPITLTPGTTASTIANWDNTGTTDIQLLVTSGNVTGNGTGTLTVEYLQGINNAS